MFSFTHRIHDPCLVYLPTFSLSINPVHVGRKKLYRSRGILGGYTSPAVSQISIIWCTICTFCSGNLCRHWTLFGSTYMTSIFLLSYYLLATNFPVAGDIAEPLDKRLDHVTMSSPFGQVAKTVDGWRWMKYLPSLNILNWVLAPPFHFQRLDYMWVTNPRSVCKKHFHHFGGVAWFCQDFGSVTSTTYRDSTLQLETCLPWIEN